MSDDDPGAAEEDEAGLAVRAVAAAAGTGIGLLVAGPVGGIAGAAATPMLELAFRRALDEITGTKRRSAQAALHSASEQVGLTPDDVVDKALTAPETTQLLADALTAASNTVDQRKIAALARALARGLRDDDAKVDEESLVVAAIAAVEAAHIRVLTQLEPERSRSRAASTNLSGRLAPRRGQSEAAIATRSGLSPAGVRAVMAVLERVGMAKADGAGEDLRLERLIFEMQQEVNKLTDLALNPPKGNISTSKKPKNLKRPGFPATTGWALSHFGRVCLAYLDNQDPDAAWEYERRADAQPDDEAEDGTVPTR